MSPWTQSCCKGATLADVGTHLFGQQGDEVSLKLRFDHLHHVLDLRGLAAVDQLIQRQQLLRAGPTLEKRSDWSASRGANPADIKLGSWNTLGIGQRSPTGSQTHLFSLF